MDHIFLLVGAGFVAGGMNALAGGGSFVTLAALVSAGVPSVIANTSSAVALYPAGITSAWVYRGGLGQVRGVPLWPALAATLAGGFAGAVLLLETPTAAFDRIVPWLLLAATAMLAVGPRLAGRRTTSLRIGLVPIVVFQFGLGVYGGYFGGAVGLMMMAVWSVFGGLDLKALNAPRTLLVSAANTVAVLCFAVAGAVWWREALAVGCGALCGGYGGAQLGRRAPAGWVRAGTVALATLLTLAFFVRAYR